MSAEEAKEPKLEDLKDLNMDNVSALIVKWVSPVEQVSPFKLGDVQKTIAQIHQETGNAVAPFFVAGQIVFLLLFLAYFVMGIIALCLDFPAMDAPCAKDSWVWLYVLLVVVIPTSVGFVIGMVQTVIQWISSSSPVKFEVPDIYFSLPAPIIYITLGVLGIVLWANMSEQCDTFYAQNHGMLLVIFHIQVIIMSVAAFLGLVTVWVQLMVLIRGWTNQESDPLLPKEGGDKKN
ncbi:hypothetical protein GUITHDRAFT_164665 [Guillardia theta CCMP2712]|uniref:Uncharacterized protein n=1 Tax=Guillardia theta (strain CCMP2712) TaxID=905079 RepID=L1IX25_GUITC|nr:hypothetical protein GUITHDRAFT_164665 [Guillardia theta CCMP2712]EKX40434.1 hypothetical protein GUITHDRAFT_164665 [Guillardia theta CCMP2712]|eukprot:XP_005827414.1 hypothetical protein GUITHDRAFT_164665 [Guillardia theta CCMP2712]